MHKQVRWVVWRLAPQERHIDMLAVARDMSMPDEQITQFDEILRASSFLLERRTKKVREYRSRNGHVVYLGVEQSRPPWRLTVHPQTAADLANSPGIEVADLYHNSNMLSFPE